jgi:DNA repair and recombination protein RAD54B
MVSKPKDTSGYMAIRAVEEDRAEPVTPLKAVVGPRRSGDLASYANKPILTAPKATGEKIVIGERANPDRANWGGAVFDPNAEGAVVMPRPPDDWAKKM